MDPRENDHRNDAKVITVTKCKKSLQRSERDQRRGPAGPGSVATARERATFFAEGGRNAERTDRDASDHGNLAAAPRGGPQPEGDRQGLLLNFKLIREKFFGLIRTENPGRGRSSSNRSATAGRNGVAGMEGVAAFQEPWQQGEEQGPGLVQEIVQLVGFPGAEALRAAAIPGHGARCLPAIGNGPACGCRRRSRRLSRVSPYSVFHAIST